MTRRRAFTLLEMIVSLAVTSVLMVLMMRMFTDSSTIWSREDERLDTFREARAALQIMARELGTVNPLPGVTETGQQEFPVLAQQYHTDTPADDQSTPGNEELYALASLPNTGRSSLCAIGYFCEWRTERTAMSQAKNCYVLRRQFTESDETFARLQQVLKATAPPAYGPSFGVLYDRKAPATTMQDLATYVWDLQFTFSPPISATGATLAVPKSYAHELPQWVEIRFKALGSAGARKLAGQNLERKTWFETRGTTYQRFILPSEQQFVTRVKLNR